MRFSTATIGTLVLIPSLSKHEGHTLAALGQKKAAGANAGGLKTIE
jgi:hypothetical protein